MSHPSYKKVATSVTFLSSLSGFIKEIHNFLLFSHRPNSALERGSTRTPTPCVAAIEETDETEPVAELSDAEEATLLEVMHVINSIT